MPKTCSLLVIRNRWHFGAQILTVPAIYFLKNKTVDASKCNVSVLSKQDTGWFYKQIPWVGNYYRQKNLFLDFMLLKKSDTLISFRPSSVRFLLLGLISGVKRKLGFSKNKISNYLWDESLVFNPFTYRGLHYLELVTADLNLSSFELMLLLRESFEYLSKDSSFYIEKQNLDNLINICVMPGGGAGKFKKWGVNNFLEVAKSLASIKKKNVIIHWLIGPDETEERTIIDSFISSSCFSICKNFHVESYLYSNLEIKDISALVSQVDITLANDCGPAHIAQCMQLGFVGVFDKYKPEWFLPHNAAECIIPDERATTEEYPILSIAPSKVTKAALKIL